MELHVVAHKRSRALDLQLASKVRARCQTPLLVSDVTKLTNAKDSVKTVSKNEVALLTAIRGRSLAAYLPGMVKGAR